MDDNQKQQIDLDDGRNVPELEDYDTDDFVSLPWFSPQTTFDENPLELDHSYGYECSNCSNLCVVDQDTLLWYTGNIIHVFNVATKKLSFRRSALGQDISCMTVNRNATCEFAVGENGDSIRAGFSSPMVIVYTWPGFTVRSVLRGGAARHFRSMDFSCDGTKLVTQAGLPDVTLTIWDVSRRHIIYTFENPNVLVNKAIFSPFDPNAFLTCGQGHVKFWRLIETFTGLKSEGLPGRFNKIENDDVCALFFLSDGRVVTNISRGNLAIWRPNALLELEFSMKNGEACHSDLVTFIHIYFKDNHVVTAGLDGYIRVWNYSYITSFYNEEQPESVHIVIEPSYERAIRNSAGISAVPILLVPKDSESEPYLFYLQDRNGGIWILDLALKKNPKPWEMIYDCHSGPVHGLSTSPAEYYFVTVGEGGKVIVYNHSIKISVATRRFNEVGTSVVWLPLNVNCSGRGIVVGFRSGILRMLNIVGLGQEPGKQSLVVVQAIRPHSSAITSIIVHKDGDILLSGSEDRSIFIHKFLKDGHSVTLKPLGMVRMPGPVCHLTWNPFAVDRVMVTCTNGQSVEVSITSEMLEAADRKIAGARDTYVMDAPVVVTLVQPSTTESVAHFSYYMKENVIWIEGNSHGLYEVGGGRIGELNIPGNQSVQCLVDVGAAENYSYQILGLSGGKIRVVKKQITDEENYSDYWEIVMHKTENSSITTLCVSYDSRFLLSCGTDSAIFVYEIREYADRSRGYHTLPVIDQLPIRLDEEKEEEVEKIPSLSLEDEKIARSQEKVRERHRIRVQEYKTELRSFIGSYHELVRVNKSLPRKFRLPKSFLRLETEEERKIEKIGMARREDIAQAPVKEIFTALSDKLDRVRAGFVDLVQTPKFCLFAVRSPYCLKSFPERKLFSVDPKPEIFNNGKIRVEDWEKTVMERTSAEGALDESSHFELLLVKILKKLQRERKKDFYLDQPVNEEPFQPRDSQREDPEDDQIPDLITAAGEFLGAYGKFSMAEHQIFQRIDRNRLRRQKCQKEMERLQKIEIVSKSETKETRLFEKLKATSKNKEKLPTLTEKLYDLLNTREQIYFTKELFNTKLKELREEKLRLINYFYWAQQEIQYIAEDLKSWNLEKSLNLNIPVHLEVAFELEFPEMMKFEPGTCPEPIAERMEMYANQQLEIQNLAPVEILKMQDVSHWRLFPLLKRRRENFMSATAALYQTLDRFVENFDKKFWPLSLERTKFSLEVSELKAEFYSILEEVDILHRYKIAQRSIDGYKSEVIKVKHVQILKENINSKKLNGLKEQMKECHRTIDDLNAKFFETIRDDDAQSPYLKELYFNKCTTTSNGQPNGGAEPVGCDEELFQQTMKLCEQRVVEENRLLEIGREQELILDEQSITKGKIKISDALLALFFATTSHYQIKLRDELENVRYLVKLNPSQVQIFGMDDPLNNLPPMEDCRLIEHEDYLTKVHTLDDMTSVLKEITGLVEKTQRSTKLLNKELEVLAQHNSSAEGEIRKLLREKYGTDTDVNDLQTYVLMNMIKKVVNRSADDLMRQKTTERKKLDSSNVDKCKFETFKTRKDRVKTLHTLYTIEAEKNRIAINRLTHQKRTGSKKINLTEEKAKLVKELKKVEAEESKIRTLIEENKI